MVTNDTIDNAKIIKVEKRKLQVDLVVQAILIALGLAGFISGEFTLWIYAFYFILGGYQLISAFTHLLFKNHSVLRKAYWPQLVLHAITFCGLIYAEDPLELAFVILFTTGFTALYYFFITLLDYAAIKK